MALVLVGGGWKTVRSVVSKFQIIHSEDVFKVRYRRNAVAEVCVVVFGVADVFGSVKVFTGVCAGLFSVLAIGGFFGQQFNLAGAAV